MNYGELFTCDVANGPGMRVSLFVSGCTHHCKGCFNPMTWDFNYGIPYSDDVTRHILDLVSAPHIRGLTILGGEPMEPENQQDVLSLLSSLQAKCPEKDVWIYSGYTFEELLGYKPSRAATNISREILELTDVLVDGEFILEQKDVSLPFRGSSNQRILDIPKSLTENKPVLFDLNML